MAPIHKILVATDFSDGSARALDYAAQLAGVLSVPLHIVHVHAPPQIAAPDSFVLATVYDETKVTEALQQALTSAAVRAREHGAPSVETELATGTAWAELVRIAAERRCDLIAIGTHGRGGVPRFILGSVADKVVRKASCPVLTIGPHA